MASKLPIILGGIVLLAAGGAYDSGAPTADGPRRKGRRSKGRLPGVDTPDEPDVDPQTGDLPDPGEPDEPDKPDVDPNVNIPPAATPLATFASIVKPTPIPGAAYQVVKGDIFGGANGIVARALTVGLGRIPSQAERSQYYKTMTRERTNFSLYGVQDKTGAKVLVTGDDGQSVTGSITSAMLKMHDSWSDAMEEQEMPVRIVGFNRGPKNPNKPNAVQGGVQPITGWQNMIHGLPRAYGVVMLPGMHCMGVANPFADESCDWPPQLFTSLGITRKDVF